MILLNILLSSVCLSNPLFRILARVRLKLSLICFFCGEHCKILESKNIVLYKDFPWCPMWSVFVIFNKNRQIWSAQLNIRMKNIFIIIIITHLLVLI